MDDFALFRQHRQKGSAKAFRVTIPDHAGHGTAIRAAQLRHLGQLRSATTHRFIKTVRPPRQICLRCQQAIVNSAFSPARQLHAGGMHLFHSAGDDF